MGAYSEEDRRVLWEQFVEVHGHQQEAYDSSIRTLAAAGVAVTASLGTALKEFNGYGVAALILLLCSLGLNLVSHWTSQRDMTTRLDSLRAHGGTAAVEGNRWTKATHTLNFLAGLALLSGGGLLAAFAWSTA